MFLLDTNACIAILNGTSKHLLARLNVLGPSEVALCSVVRGELLYGARKSQRVTANLQKVMAFCGGLVSLPYDDAAAEHYGMCRMLLEKAGTRIGEADLLIACIALACDATVVTRNEREFIRVPGLRVETFV
jgi:tRNA(fMet)-specific endonuclease VapC